MVGLEDARPGERLCVSAPSADAQPQSNSACDAGIVEGQPRDYHEPRECVASPELPHGHAESNREDGSTDFATYVGDYIRPPDSAGADLLHADEGIRSGVIPEHWPRRAACALRPE